jgi:hypothetical protein
MTGCSRRDTSAIESNTPMPNEITTEVGIPSLTSLPTYYPAYQTPAAVNPALPANQTSAAGNSALPANQTSAAGNSVLPASQTPAAESSASPTNQAQITASSATTPPNFCPLGTGLREETIDILIKYKDHPGFTMTASSELAETIFPQLGGWIRVIGAPSYEMMQNKAERAKANAVPYEGLGYGLETSRSTPGGEWGNLIDSTRRAEELANEYGKLLVMGPGFQLMDSNEDKYTPMAAMSDIWIFQTQQLQKNPPGSIYKDEAQRIINLIRADHPDIQIWAQITFLPDREPDMNVWLEYRQLIADMVDGTYIGVYTWDRVSNEQLITTIESIYQTVCGDS